MSVWLFGVFSVGVALMLCFIQLNMGGNGRISNACFYAATISVACLFEGSRRTRKIDQLAKHMVVSAVMSCLLITITLVTMEVRNKGSGFAYGTTLLAFAMFECLVTCFYVTFAVLEIQLKEAKDLEDTFLYGIRIFIDVFYAIFLVLLKLWEKVWR